MKKTSLLGMVEKKPAATIAPVAPPAPEDRPQAAPAAREVDRQRVVVRLNLEAVEALEDISRDQRRAQGRAVPVQQLMEEAVTDLLRKYGKAAVVLPAPAKRTR